MDIETLITYLFRGGYEFAYSFDTISKVDVVTIPDKSLRDTQKEIITLTYGSLYIGEDKGQLIFCSKRTKPSSYFILKQSI